MFQLCCACLLRVPLFYQRFNQLIHFTSAPINRYNYRFRLENKVPKDTEKGALVCWYRVKWQYLVAASRFLFNRVVA